MSVRESISKEMDGKAVLVAVSKTKPQDAILLLYAEGQRDFGENYVQELVEKQAALPGDILWHFIGHLQSNKVKQIAPFVHLIHAVDSLKLLQEISKEAIKNNRIIDVLLQLRIATEETKYGLQEESLNALVKHAAENPEPLAGVRFRGLMGMASNTEDEAQIRREFSHLQHVFLQLKKEYFPEDEGFSIKSMGMSSDYKIALESGSTMLRVGSLLFGNRG